MICYLRTQPTCDIFGMCELRAPYLGDLATRVLLRTTYLCGQIAATAHYYTHLRVSFAACSSVFYTAVDGHSKIYRHHDGAAAEEIDVRELDRFENHPFLFW